MNKELINLIESGESGTVEFKESFGKSAIETIVAFANSDGGFLCIGIENNGVIKGVTAKEENIKDWLNQLKMATEPSLFPRYNVFDQDKCSVVLFIVQEYPLKPVACKGRYLKRHGASNHLLTSDEIVALKLQSMNASFDSFTVDGEVNRLDQDALGKFTHDIKHSGRYTPCGDIHRDLEKLGFTKEGQLTRAADLLFGNHHTAIHLGRFKSRHTIVDDLVIRAPLILAVDEAMEFMKKNMRLGYEFTGELKRKETWQYPLTVLRELLLNAIIHKDYRDPTDVIIKMFDEYIEFTNPGELFGELKLEALHTDFYRASHRNKLLAEAFYLTGEVEKYGTGFIRIRNLLKKDYSHMGLVLVCDSGAFRVSVGIVEAFEETAPETAPEPAPENTREHIVKLLQENPRLTKQDLMDILQKASGTIKEHIRILKKEGRIERVGPDKGGYWNVVEK
ncbi:MAG: putative DNA binding domain-containing protein [Pseudomonadota bacterium]|nr:putative DNA binding domain-containing protein [Pseudomonadota bacterium]